MAISVHVSKHLTHKAIRYTDYSRKWTVIIGRGGGGSQVILVLNCVIKSTVNLITSEK